MKLLISVVTVCYNAADTIEKTMLSVLNQTYHDIEYIIIDGGSTDGTVEIIRKYADRIAYWVSEPDKGIYDAMNKGIKVATGEWINFMNAGDEFVDEGVIEKLFQNRTIDTVGVVFGDTLFIHKSKQKIVKFGDDPHHKIMPSCHQSIFCRRILLARILFDLRYKIAADYNLFFQLRQMDIEFQYVQLVVAVYDAANGISSRNEWSTQKEMLKIESRSLVYFIRVCLLGLKLCVKKVLIILKMKKVMLVFGTRPEAIKMAPLVKAFQKEFDKFQTIVCVTGQHREMLDQVLGIFDIKPDYDLNIMKQGQDLYDVTSRVLLGMRDVLKKVRPDIVLVHGDTTTSTAAALAAFYQQIPVGHVEAGLRTHNIYSPWPEEMNRQITGRIATYHFSPTPLSRQNLLAEGLREEAVMVTGNTVIDALYMVVDKIKSDKILDAKLEDTLNQAGYNVNRLANGKKLVLITGHRRENFGDGFISMCTAIKDLAQKYPDVDFVYPMHLNPNVRKPIHEVFGENLSGLSNMFFIEPLEYLSFIYLMEKSAIVLTDSGGIQEEAPGLGKPVLVMRDTTERPEALEAGTVKLVGTNYEKIVNEVSALLDDSTYYDKMSRAVNPYGDGKACQRICDILSY